MMTGRHFRVYPNETQKHSLRLMIEAQCQIYKAKIEEARYQNWLKHRAILSPSWVVLDLDERSEYKVDQSYSKYRQNNEIPSVPSQVLRNGINKYVQAVRNHQRDPIHWRRPRPHRKGGSLGLTRDLFEFRDGRLRVGRPRWQVGFIRMQAHRDFGIPASITIRETDAGRWFVGFSFDDDRSKSTSYSALKKRVKAEGEKALEGKVLGVDRGLKPLAALSSGEDLGLDAVLHGPRAKRLQARVRHLKQKLARQRDKVSKRRQKTIRALARTRERLQDLRRDAFHKAVHRMVSGPETVIVLENLDLKHMRRSMLAAITSGRTLGQPAESRRRVASAMVRASLGEFGSILQAAAQRAEKLVLTVPPQHTSTTCSVCGHRSPENRPERDEFRCVECKHAMDPDLNAARNIARRGVQKLFNKKPGGQPGVIARGGAGRKARGTTPKAGPSTKGTEKPHPQETSEAPLHATKYPAGPLKPISEGDHGDRSEPPLSVPTTSPPPLPGPHCGSPEELGQNRKKGHTS